MVLASAQRAVHLAAALVGNATAVATADTQLLAAAQRRRLDVSNPLLPRGDA